MHPVQRHSAVEGKLVNVKLDRAIPMRRTSRWFRALIAGTTAAFAVQTAACDFGAITGLCESGNDPVGSIQIQPSAATLPVGGEIQLTATLMSPGGTFILCEPPTFWLSANGAIARVQRGGVRAMAPGTTYVLARAGGKADSVLVKVTPAQ
jgi:hypothetical protein